VNRAGDGAASSPRAVCQSVNRRSMRLEAKLEEEKLLRRGARRPRAKTRALACRSMGALRGMRDLLVPGRCRECAVRCPTCVFTVG